MHTVAENYKYYKDRMYTEDTKGYNMPRKNLKVSEIVHEELEVRKRRDESFDDVLKRELGITPTSVKELTTYYPAELEEAVQMLVGFFGDTERYAEFITDHEEYFALNFDAKESRRTIFQLRFSNDPPCVEVYFRNDRGELEFIGQAIQQSDDEYVIIDFEFLRPDTGSKVDAIVELEHFHEDFGEGLRSLEDAAYQRWG